MCPVCFNKKDKIVYFNLDQVYKTRIFNVNKKLSINRCLSCGIVFTNPHLSYSDLKDYYTEDYGAFHITERSAFFNKFKDLIKNQTLNQYFNYGSRKWWRFLLYLFKFPLAHYPLKLENGRILDVGCGAGNYLMEVKKLGWEPYGLDPSPIAVKVAKGRGLNNISIGTLPGFKFGSDFFDAVVMFHVFEHIPNPNEVLEEIKRILKPGGTLIIGLPNFNSFGSKIFRKYWAGLSFPLHYFHYNGDTLSLLLERHKFSITGVAYANLFSDIFVSSPQNLFILAAAYNLQLSIQKIFGLANIFFGAIDYFFGNLLANAFRCGSQITVISKVNK